MSFKKIIFAVGAVFAIGLIILFAVARPEFGSDPNPVLLRVPKGASSVQIIRMLEENQAIRSPFFFKLLMRLSFRPVSFRHGTYQLEKNHYSKTLRQLKQGLTYRIKVTFPEGWSSYQIAERLEKNGIVASPEPFYLFAKQNELEGTLFPETYYFEPQSDEESIAGEMTRQFARNYGAEFKARAAELKLTDRQVLTLASIIEREARVDSERATISSVYHNRLRVRKMLEADPTVQYAISEGRFWKERLTYKDLDSKSPYNTYRRVGLPPGPICNPGIESIRAALYPAKTDFLYFVADPDGSGVHHFSRTYEQHMQKQRDFRRNRRTASAGGGAKSQ